MLENSLVNIDYAGTNVRRTIFFARLLVLLFRSIQTAYIAFKNSDALQSEEAIGYLAEGYDVLQKQVSSEWAVGKFVFLQALPTLLRSGGNVLGQLLNEQSKSLENMEKFRIQNKGETEVRKEAIKAAFSKKPRKRGSPHRLKVGAGAGRAREQCMNKRKEIPCSATPTATARTWLGFHWKMPGMMQKKVFHQRTLKKRRRRSCSTTTTCWTEKTPRRPVGPREEYVGRGGTFILGEEQMQSVYDHGKHLANGSDLSNYYYFRKGLTDEECEKVLRWRPPGSPEGLGHGRTPRTVRARSGGSIKPHGSTRNWQSTSGSQPDAVEVRPGGFASLCKWGRTLRSPKDTTTGTWTLGRRTVAER